MYVFSGTFFGHLFAGVLLLGSYLLLKRKKFILSGLLAGLTFLSEYNLAVLILGWVLILLWKEMKIKPVLLFSLGVLPSIVLILLYNTLFSTSPLVFLYKYHNYHELYSNYGFRLPSLESVWGLSFSPYRGMFFYVPVLIAGLPMLIKKIMLPGRTNLLKNYLVLPSVAYFIFIASYFGWWGGWTYGPRLLMGLTIILLYELVIRLVNNPISKIFFALLIFFGIMIAVLAKITIVYDAPTGVYFPLAKLIIPKLLSGNLNPNNFLSLYTSISATFSAVIFILFLGLGIGLLTFLYKIEFRNSDI